MTFDNQPNIISANVTHEGDANGLQTVLNIQTDLNLNMQHPDYDETKVNALIDFCVQQLKSDFPVASRFKVFSA